MRQFQKYLKEVVSELKKVTWPTQEECMGSTMVVIIFSAMLTGFIFAVDFLLAWILQKAI